MDVYWHDAHELEKGVDGGGAESTGDVAHCLVLGSAELSEKARLAGEPDWGGVGEDREDDSVVDCAPLGPFKASDGVSEEVKSFEG